jgi:tetratricopeptide (TPR) repeat protein
LLKAGQTEAAIPELQEMIQLQPASAQWHAKLGQAYLDSEPMEPRKALDQFMTALDLDDNLDLTLELAICWSELGDSDKADRIFNAGLLPEDPEALASEPAVNYYLGRKAFDAEEYQKASQYFQAAAADPRWDARSEPYRQKIAKIVLGADARKRS